jgi:hypothetical protein
MRDLNPVMHQRMQNVCYFLAVTTPFGRRIIQVIVDYVCGEGFRVVAEDPNVQQVVERFWKDPINRMDENLPELFKELLIFGELCQPFAVNPVDGFVRLAYIDPQDIDTVEYGMLQTATSQEISVASAVHLRQRIGEQTGRRLSIVGTDEDPNSQTFGGLNGDCFFNAINKAKSATRGISEIFSLADWIDVFDNMIFDFADRLRFLNSFVWQFVLTGADEDKVNAFDKKIKKNPPRQGTTMTTNENVEIKAMTPDLKGGDMSDASRVVKLYGMGGAGLPAWFFADPVDSNRSTAQEMQGPTGKMLTSRQNILRRMIHNYIDFVIDQAVAHGTLKQNVNRAYRVDAPDLSVDDIGAGATALQNATPPLTVAEDRGWITSETAASSFHAILSQVGVSVEQGEFDKAQAQKTERDAKQQDAILPQKNLADALAAAAGKKPGVPTPETELVQ